MEAATGGPALRRALNGRRRASAGGVLARRSEFVSLFARAGANLQETAERSCQLLHSWPDNQELVSEITRCEHEGDRLTREIIHRLYRSRIGPWDRGDIHALAEAIDDVVDEIEETSEQLAAYSIEAPMEQAQELAGVVRDSARAVSRALDNFRDGTEIEQQMTDVRVLEHEGDRIYRRAVASLFDGGIDPMLVIRWKDILQGLEDAIDRSRQAMDILHGFVLKHS